LSGNEALLLASVHSPEYFEESIHDVFIDANSSVNDSCDNTSTVHAARLESLLFGDAKYIV
jgi:hypothetical protein